MISCPLNLEVVFLTRILTDKMANMVKSALRFPYTQKTGLSVITISRA